MGRRRARSSDDPEVNNTQMNGMSNSVSRAGSFPGALANALLPSSSRWMPGKRLAGALLVGLMMVALPAAVVHAQPQQVQLQQVQPQQVWPAAQTAYPPPVPGYVPMATPPQPAPPQPGAPVAAAPAERPVEPSEAALAQAPAQPPVAATPSNASDTAVEPKQPDADHGSGLTRDDSAECMRCHWMETMAYRDPDTRQIVDLSVDRDAYEHSVHQDLSCRDCHDRGYKHYPHRASSADEGLTCVGCHDERQNDPEGSPPNLAGFDIQYQHSVHAMEAEQEAGVPFDCFSCHDPHSFRPLPNDTPVPEVVAANNQLCLDCHTALDSPVPKGHEWLPRPRQHWGAVRCLDCHTPQEGRDLYAPSHQLLGAAESNQNCVECHSQGGELLSQLYVHRASEEREQQGFLAHAVYNDAYIIGMSRSPTIDRIGLAVVGLMILGVAVHGLGRYVASKRKRASQ
jgi:hypothetical protein